jgi:uracil-DNA glycosylase|tara:strand:+ start:68268 stop:68942 length:675 start_codon:yes stop_codon:yes gene_type:complete
LKTLDLPAKYIELKNEVESYYLDYETNADVKNRTEKYYKGIQILFSPLILKPKIMFIGINPGAGFYNYNGKHVKRFSPLNKMEYSYGEYRLAKQTRKLFELAGLTNDDLKNSVKSNCFFFATKNEKELYQFLSHLKPTGVYTKSKKWINILVKIVEPRIIICEGKSAFDRFIKDKDCEIKTHEKVLFAKWNEIKIIGYKRNFSNIMSINDVAQKLKKAQNNVLQ